MRHWESHIKFAFAGTPAADGGQDGDAAHRRLGSYVAHFGENLLHRVLELQRKLAITDAPNAASSAAASAACSR